MAIIAILLLFFFLNVVGGPSGSSEREGPFIASLFAVLFQLIYDYYRNDQQYALIVPNIYSIYWLLHVSAVACHHQGAA
jgi:hypothetical protein